MSKQGIEVLESWLAEDVTPVVKLSIHGDAASKSVEMAERLIADAANAGLSLDDLEPEFGAPEVLIREALESDDGSVGE